MADYEIGYGRPPKAFQFQRGRSGNPSGRPRKTTGIRELFEKVGKQKVLVNGKNGRRYMTKVEAAFTQLANKAAAGDLKAIDTYLKWKMILSPGLVRAVDMEAMATSATAELYALLEAHEGSLSEGSAERDKLPDQRNATPPKGDTNSAGDFVPP